MQIKLPPQKNHIFDILRIEMPQIDSIGHFVKWMDKNGCKPTIKSVKIKDLKYAQSQINKAKIERILKSGFAKKDDRKFIVDKYNRILDGNHSIVAKYNIDPDQKIQVTQFNIPIGSLLRMAKKYSKVKFKGINKNIDIDLIKGRAAYPNGTVSPNGKHKKIAGKWVRIKSPVREKAKQPTKQELIKKYKDYPEYIELMNLPKSAWKERLIINKETGQKRKVLILTKENIRKRVFDAASKLFTVRAGKLGESIGLNKTEIQDLKYDSLSLLDNALHKYGYDHDPKTPKDLLHHFNKQLLPLRHIATKIKMGNIQIPQNIVRYANRYLNIVKEVGTDPNRVYNKIDWTIGDIHPDLKKENIGSNKIPLDDFSLKGQSDRIKQKKESALNKIDKEYHEIKKQIDHKFNSGDDIDQKLMDKKKLLEGQIEKEKSRIVNDLTRKINTLKKNFAKIEMPVIVKRNIANMEKVIENPDSPKIKELSQNIEAINKEVDMGKFDDKAYEKAMLYLNVRREKAIKKMEETYKFENKRRGAKSIFKELDNYFTRKGNINLDDKYMDSEGNTYDRIQIEDEGAYDTDHTHNIQQKNLEAQKLKDLIGKVAPQYKELLELFFGVHASSPKMDREIKYGAALTKVSEILKYLPKSYYQREEKQAGTSDLLKRVEAKTRFKNPNYNKELVVYNKKKVAAKKAGKFSSEWTKENPPPPKTYSKESPQGQKLFKDEWNKVYRLTVKGAKRKGKELSESTKKTKILNDIRDAKKKIYQNINLFLPNPIFRESETILKKSF